VRVYRAKGLGWRSVESLATGDRYTIIGQLLDTGGAVDNLGIPRKMLRDARPPYPTAEHLCAGGPAGVVNKQRKGFTTAWYNAVNPAPMLSDLPAGAR
jgi:hypothetical protein